MPKTLLDEYTFFWNIERAIQPVIDQQKRLDKEMADFRKSIGL